MPGGYYLSAKGGAIRTGGVVCGRGPLWHDLARGNDTPPHAHLQVECLLWPE